ncbi:MULTISPECIES: hypothetical protein [unclassified Massilia]|uniref:hypothetical protein n=1 Tax=unclassified Massilia TaxID=2609279 RepID=UPI001781F0C8|nr:MULTISPECIES: hypothetical protein [unclassified Massilia]MBD8532609.1 hypothetical protein [Massilia sp. CFBP 13647]MBD8675970.1 hypothetical protein [Massilia sp. CFBP 13721]
MKRFILAAAVGTALAGCSTGAGEIFASQDRTVEYVRVFDIKTDAPPPAVVRAASEGISRNISNATLATPLPETAEVLDQPGRFKLADAPGAARGPSCDGATWTAKARPDVRGGQDMHIVACLYAYKTGYHLDMYAGFTKKEGGWLEWPRRATGMVLGTPEKFAEKTMLDVVRTIRESTRAQVALVEAKPDVSGAPWLEAAPAGTQASKP